MTLHHPSSAGPGFGLPGRRVLLAALALFLVAGTAIADKWQPVRPESHPSFQARLEKHAEVEALTGELRQALSRPRPLEAGARAQRETAEVGVFLLAFRENRRPDLTTVPVDGRFMAATDTLPTWLTKVDPPPHDAAFFGAHMRALAEYYRIMSYGQLDVEWDIVEGPDDGVFLLPDIADYGPGEEEGYWTLELLEAFVRTALDSIDATLQADPDGPRFADYEHIMVFHAGSDLQNDIYGDSPNDLPSFNIFFGEPALVDGGEHQLGSVLLLPETTTQDTDPENPTYGALNAVTAHEFAHQLDMVDTYNTYWGWPSVGYWDLMDSGHQILYGFQTLEADTIYAYGALPTSLAIWHRMLKGWVNEADGSLLRPGGGETDVELYASNRQLALTKAVRVDLSDREYFLLESRQEYVLPQSRYVKSDPETGVFLYAGYDHPEIPDSTVNSGEYDLFIPQSGLLAWHVDERDFETLYPLNAINLDHDRHFRLVEADGARDLGNPYSWNWRGNDRDPFYTGNNTEWLETTIPNTRLRDGTPSGFALDQLVTADYLQADADSLIVIDPVLRFRIRRSGVPAGYPRDDRERVPGTLARLPLTGSLLPLGDHLAYFMSSLDADTLEQAHWLSAAIDPEEAAPLAPVALGATPTGSLVLPTPVGGDPAWLFLTADSLHLWSQPSGTEGADRLLEIELPASALTLPVAHSDADSTWAVWLDADGYLPVLSYANLGRNTPTLRRGPRITPMGNRDAAPVTAPLAVAMVGEAARLCLAIGDTLSLVDLHTMATTAKLPTPDPGEGPFWILPVESEEGATDDLYWVDVTGRVARLTEDGPTDAFTVDLPGGRLGSAPAVADLDADGRPELFLAARSRVYRLSFRGHSHADWPLRLEEMADLDAPMRIGSGLRAADLTGDGVSELIFFADSGHLLVMGAAGRPILGTPRSLSAAPPQDLLCSGEAVYAVSRDGFQLVYEGAGSADVPEWGAGGGNVARSGRWQRRHAIVEVGDPADEGWTFYPNPAGAWTRLHHAGVPAGTQVRLELFDLEGQHKFSRELTAVAAGPLEMQLELRSLASGVYFCRIEVQSDGQIRHFLRRLGVQR